MRSRGRRTPTNQDAFSGPRAAKLAGVSYRRLHYWTRRGLIAPSVTSGEGSGRFRLYSARDVFILRLVVRLRQEGVSLMMIQRALARVGTFAADRFLVQGGRLFVRESTTTGAALDVAAHGQLFFSVVLEGLGATTSLRAGGVGASIGMPRKPLNKAAGRTAAQRKAPRTEGRAPTAAVLIASAARL
jgi:DNA-binding transcriptional MerR regulator